MVSPAAGTPQGEASLDEAARLEETAGADGAAVPPVAQVADAVADVAAAKVRASLPSRSPVDACVSGSVFVPASQAAQASAVSLVFTLTPSPCRRARRRTLPTSPPPKSPATSARRARRTSTRTLSVTNMRAVQIHSAAPLIRVCWLRSRAACWGGLGWVGW